MNLINYFGTLNLSEFFYNVLKNVFYIKYFKERGNK